MIKSSIEIVEERYKGEFAKISQSYQRMQSFLLSSGFSKDDINFIKSKKGTKDVYEVASSFGKGFDPNEFMQEYRRQKEPQVALLGQDIIVTDAYRPTQRYLEPDATGMNMGLEGKILTRSSMLVPIAAAASFMFMYVMHAQPVYAKHTDDHKKVQKNVLDFEWKPKSDDVTKFAQEYLELIKSKVSDNVLDPHEISELYAYLSQKIVPDKITLKKESLAAFKMQLVDEWKKAEEAKVKSIKDITRSIDDKILSNYPGLSIGKPDNMVIGISYDALRKLSKEGSKYLATQIEQYNNLPHVAQIEIREAADIEFLVKSYLKMLDRAEGISSVKAASASLDLLISAVYHRQLLQNLDYSTEQRVELIKRSKRFWHGGLSQVILRHTAKFDEDKSNLLKNEYKPLVNHDFNIEPLDVKYPLKHDPGLPLIAVIGGIAIPIIRKAAVANFVRRKVDKWDWIGLGANIFLGTFFLDIEYQWWYPARLVGAWYVTEPLRTLVGNRKNK